jgi:hypothetical protein
MSLSTRRERSTTAATRLQEKPCEGGPAAGKPQGKAAHVLRVVILRTLVGMRMGPLTRRSLSLALLMRSFETGEEQARKSSVSAYGVRGAPKERREAATYTSRET